MFTAELGLVFWRWSWFELEIWAGCCLMNEYTLAAQDCNDAASAGITCAPDSKSEMRTSLE